MPVPLFYSLLSCQQISHSESQYLLFTHPASKTQQSETKPSSCSRCPRLTKLPHPLCTHPNPPRTHICTSGSKTHHLPTNKCPETNDTKRDPLFPLQPPFVRSKRYRSGTELSLSLARSQQRLPATKFPSYTVVVCCWSW